MPFLPVPTQPGNRLRLEALHRAAAGETAVEVYYAETAGELAEKDFQTELDEEEYPEILRSNLAATVLGLMKLGVKVS